jgi:hypothetical protein
LKEKEMDNQQTVTVETAKVEESKAVVVPATEQVTAPADAGVEVAAGEGEGETVAAEVAPVPKEEAAPLQLTPTVGLLAVLLAGLVSVAVVRLRK